MVLRKDQLQEEEDEEEDSEVASEAAFLEAVVASAEAEGNYIRNKFNVASRHS